MLQRNLQKDCPKYKKEQEIKQLSRFCLCLFKQLMRQRKLQKDWQPYKTEQEINSRSWDRFSDCFQCFECVPKAGEGVPLASRVGKSYTSVGVEFDYQEYEVPENIESQDEEPVYEQVYEGSYEAI